MSKTAAAAEIMRRGGSLLGEPCPRCGGLQVRYKGRNLCLKEDDLSGIESKEQLGVDDVISNLRELIVEKIQEVSRLLDEEHEIENQMRLAGLLQSYVKLLNESSLIAEGTSRKSASKDENAK